MGVYMCGRVWYRVWVSVCMGGVLEWVRVCVCLGGGACMDACVGGCMCVCAYVDSCVGESVYACVCG